MTFFGPPSDLLGRARRYFLIAHVFLLFFYSGNVGKKQDIQGVRAKNGHFPQNRRLKEPSWDR